MQIVILLDESAIREKIIIIHNYNLGCKKKQRDEENTVPICSNLFNTNKIRVVINELMVNTNLFLQA